MNTTQVLGIDQGTYQSAWVLWNGQTVLGHGIEPNFILIDRLRNWPMPYPDFAIEELVSYGPKTASHELLDAAYIGGVFVGTWPGILHITRMRRVDIKKHLCGTIAGVNDAVLRGELIHRFGGKEKAVGKKATPGPFYGIKSHTWQALALAVAVWDQVTLERVLPLDAEYEQSEIKEHDRDRKA